MMKRRKKKTGVREVVAVPEVPGPELPGALGPSPPMRVQIEEAEKGDPPPMILQARALIMNEALTSDEGGAQSDLRLALALIDAIIERYPELTAPLGERR